MTVDVVIPTRDRPARLAATLNALAQQNCGEFGVIVVDDGGMTVAQHVLPDTALNVQVVRNDVSLGPGASRNRGVSASTAQYVVFMDDDCVAVPELIGLHRTALESGGPIVSLGPILSPAGQRLSVWNHWDADRLQRVYERLRAGECAPEWRHLYTGNVGVRRADFAAVGGFDARFTRQEDVELGYRLARLGCRFSFDPAAVVYHDSDRTLRAWTRIPAVSARFDVLMDQLDPDSARLANVLAKQDDKRLALRLFRRVIRGSVTRRWGVSTAISAGRALHAARLDRAGMAAYSLVWDLIYDDALRKALAEREPVGSSP
jgi:GT2 family glycosyltransferase